MTSRRSIRPSLPTASWREGFTMVEMLVVLAIIAILAVLALPAVKGMLGSMDMKGAASIVGGQFDLARQTASTRNVEVDIRIYQDPSVPDSNASGNPAYRIIAAVIPGSGSTPDEFLSPGVGLPGDIIFDQAANYSSLLDPSQTDPTGAARATTVEATTAPLLVRGKTYMKIPFIANGTVYLTNNSTNSGFWCLSLRNLHAKAVTTPNPEPAQNFICMVLDPSTSRLRVYQP
jgi:uncharacterized protein (TIGR02596 family)